MKIIARAPEDKVEIIRRKTYAWFQLQQKKLFLHL